MQRLIFMLWLIGAPVQAAPPALDWPTVLRAASERQMLTAQTQADAERSQAETQRAQGWLAGAPTVESLYRSDQTLSQQGAGEMQLGIRLPLRRAGQTQAWVELARQTELDAHSRAQAAQLALLGQLRTLAWDYRLAQNRLLMAQNRHTQLQQQLQATERAVRRGETAALDADLLRVRVLEATANLATEQAQTDAMRARWHNMTGLNELPADLGQTPIPDALTQLTDANGLIQQQPLLAHLAEQVELARATLAATRAEGAGAPELGIALKRDRSDRQVPWDNSVQLSFSLPIGGEAYRAPQLASLNQQRTAAHISLVQTTQTLWGDILDLRARLAAWPNRIALLEQRAALAEAVLRKQARAHQLGEIDGTSWLVYERDAAEARLAASEARLLAARDASQLKQAYGLMPPSLSQTGTQP
ncbi:TolC family protein [Halothiobacillus sp. DCM-1]|uniref:TolC family protein n=1 Tax=Halothiobacillus sp. DCM-1 TaxID=3112558 RepID=UPI0032497635